MANKTLTWQERRDLASELEALIDNIGRNDVDLDGATAVIQQVIKAVDNFGWKVDELNARRQLPGGT